MSKVGKRKGGLFSRAWGYVAGKKPPDFQEALINEGPTVSSFSAAYDDAVLEGGRVIDGRICNTVGEYKAACAKKYGPDGYGP